MQSTSKTIIAPRLTRKQSQRYESHFVRNNVRIRASRTIPQVESLAFRLHKRHREHHLDHGDMLMRRIYVNGGNAHCRISHPEDQLNPWWEYHVAREGSDFIIGFDWVKTPSKPVNLELGQAYYDNDRWEKVLLARWWRMHQLFNFLLEKWLREKENRPRANRDVLRLNINARPYLFVAVPNRHGGIFWDMISDPTFSTVREMSL